MFPSLAARPVAETNFAGSETRKCFCLRSKTFLLPGHKLPKHMFPCLVTMYAILRFSVLLPKTLNFLALFGNGAAKHLFAVPLI